MIINQSVKPDSNRRGSLGPALTRRRPGHFASQGSDRIPRGDRFWFKWAICSRIGSSGGDKHYAETRFARRGNCSRRGGVFSPCVWDWDLGDWCVDCAFLLCRSDAVVAGSYVRVVLDSCSRDWIPGGLLREDVCLFLVSPIPNWKRRTEISDLAWQTS